LQRATEIYFITNQREAKWSVLSRGIKEQKKKQQQGKAFIFVVVLLTGYRANLFS